MISSIFVATSGMRGYEHGLRVISDNTANISTPGYKSSSQQFANMVGGNPNESGNVGYGLNALGADLNFSQGELQNTGNDLDLAIEGQGLFTLKTSDGAQRYTRAGQFKFNNDGQLVSRISGETVLGYDSKGVMGPISIDSLKTDAGKATQNITFKGHLASSATTHTINGVNVRDAAGNTYTLSVRLDAVSGTPNTWTVTLLNGTTTVGTGTLSFTNGVATGTQAQIAVTFNPPNQDPVPLTLDFSTDVTSTNTSTTSSLTFNTQDGHGIGQLTSVSFDATGTLSLAYSNGNTVKGPRLALARFSSSDAVASVGDNEYAATNPEAWEVGVAGESGFGNVRAGMIEMSNVDLSQQFSELVIMQRGYQACSQVVSTANDMLTELFAMRK